jgi:DNA-binding transcriptional LysR family regulator
MLKLDGLATFVAIAEAGSISETARRLRLSKSVVSDRLTELERSLGANLVHRSTRRLMLTEDGIAFLERASRIAHEVEVAAPDMAERRGALVGPLRISAPVTFGRIHLGPAVYPFIAKHPRIELTIDLDDRSAVGFVLSHDTISLYAPIAASEGHRAPKGNSVG